MSWFLCAATRPGRAGFAASMALTSLASYSAHATQVS
jgi:hypothetical protein